jgi:RNA polymerase sigma-70 factor (ECF subfamily)
METPESHHEDVTLLERVAAGEEAALGALYDRHSRLLFGLILRILRNRAEAEEVLQEVFVHVWTRSERFDRVLGPPAAWLVRIARNRAIDRLRANKVRERTLDALNPEPPAGRDDLRVARSEAQMAVLRALAALPDEQRDLIEHAYFLGLTHSELADRFGVPLGTVKTRVRSGLMALRRELAGLPSSEHAHDRVS